MPASLKTAKVFPLVLIRGCVWKTAGSRQHGGGGGGG